MNFKRECSARTRVGFSQWQANDGESPVIYGFMGQPRARCLRMQHSISETLIKSLRFNLSK